MAQQRMYGTWRSPISAADAARGAARLNDLAWAGDTLIWCESGTLYAQAKHDAPRQLTPPDQNVRGRIGYGGGEFTANKSGVVFAGNDGRLYHLGLEGGIPRPLTPSFGKGSAAAAPIFTPGGQVIYVYSIEGEDGLALIDPNGDGFPRKIAHGHDFYMQPAVSPKGEWLAYAAWDRPSMPWDSTVIHLARCADGALHDDRVIAGGAKTSVAQPTFSPDGKYLAYVSDSAGWWQLYLYDLDTERHHRLTPNEVEYSIPMWLQGFRTFAFTPDGTAVYAIYVENGIYGIKRINVNTGDETRITALDEYPHLKQIAISENGEIALIVGGSTHPDRVVTLDAQAEQVTIRRRSGYEGLSAGLSKLQPIAWATPDGDTAHGFYYPPVSFYGESGWGAPPLIVEVHGGPTSQARPQYDAEIQFFTTRGFAYLQVNHRGGTGYGKAYKDRHHGGWGVYDVDDSVSGALHLVEQGLANRDQLVILGGSAGGFSVLQALIDQPGVFKAGVCLYGVANQFSITFESDWKFEADYNYTLLGTLPDSLDQWRRMSPAFNADKIRDPLIIFQGEDDEVVPKSQSDEIVAAVRRRGVPHEYHVYAGEGHGFRKPETITHYLETTLKFLKAQVLYK